MSFAIGPTAFTAALSYPAPPRIPCPSPAALTGRVGRRPVRDPERRWHRPIRAHDCNSLYRRNQCERGAGPPWRGLGLPTLLQRPGAAVFGARGPGGKARSLGRSESNATLGLARSRHRPAKQARPATEVLAAARLASARRSVGRGVRIGPRRTGAAPTLGTIQRSASCAGSGAFACEPEASSAVKDSGSGCTVSPPGG
jgi:hypothetical protein